MTQTAHTSGPWKHSSGAHDVTGIYTSYIKDGNITPCVVAEVIHHGGQQFETWLPTAEDQANARLIAAAPRMKDALLAIYADCCRAGNYGPTVALIEQVLVEAGVWEEVKETRAAIAKATSSNNQAA